MPDPIDLVTLSGQTPDIPESASCGTLTGTLIEFVGMFKIGKLIKSYTLQYAEVGPAVDYTKRSYVLRLRPEAEQFLLQARSQEDHISWINSLQMGIDLALPLEERDLPTNYVIPRRRWRPQSEEAHSPRVAATANATSPPAGTGERQEQSESQALAEHKLLSRIAKRLRSNSVSASARVSSAETSGSGISQPPANPQSVPGCSQNNSSSSNSGEDDELERAEFSDYSLPDSLDDNEDDYNDDDNDAHDDDDYMIKKWEPAHPEQTNTMLLKDAYRCLRPLPSTAPWLDKPVYRKGRKCIVKQERFEQPGLTTPIQLY